MTSDPPPEPRRSRPAWTTVVVLLVGAAVLVGAVLGVVLTVGTGGGDEHPARTHRYVIPAGTAWLIETRRTTDVMPELMNVRVGDRLVLVNDDDQLHVVGPFSVRPGETFEFTFPSPGVYVGACTLNAVQTATVVVKE